MIRLDPFLQQLRALCVDEWPEVLKNAGGGDVPEAEHANMIAWAKLHLPYAVLLVEENKLWEGRPLGRNIRRVTVSVFYAAETRGPVTGLRQKLEDLASRFDPGEQPLATAQRLSVGDPAWGDDLYANQQLRAANLSARAGVVPITFLVSG